MKVIFIISGSIRKSFFTKGFSFFRFNRTPKDVPDPYYTGDFQETYDLVLEGCTALLEKIKEELL